MYAPRRIRAMAEVGPAAHPCSAFSPSTGRAKEIIRRCRETTKVTSFWGFPIPGGVDIPALMASGRQKWHTIHNQGNPVFGCIWNTVRRRSWTYTRATAGSNVYSIGASGVLGLPLPDQDHGAGHSSLLLCHL